MCCTGGSSNKNKTVSAVPAQSKAKAAIPASSAFQKANPFVIPKNIKNQLVLNQQMARIPSKSK